MTDSTQALRDLVRMLHVRPAVADGPLTGTIEVLLSSTGVASGRRGPAGPDDDPYGEPGADPDARRLRALVELACAGDAEAFGHLYDHYVRQVYRFVAYRVGSRALAEDITSETFARALRSVRDYRWQGKDFGAWLSTIARNLLADHYKASRTRSEITTDEVPDAADPTAGPEEAVLATIAGDAVMSAVAALPDEQRDCVLMRFVQGLTIAQTAEALGRSEGAVKQLQLRAVRRLARELPPEAVR